MNTNDNNNDNNTTNDNNTPLIMILRIATY